MLSSACAEFLRQRGAADAARRAALRAATAARRAAQAAGAHILPARRSPVGCARLASAARLRSLRRAGCVRQRQRVERLPAAAEAAPVRAGHIAAGSSGVIASGVPATGWCGDSTGGVAGVRRRGRRRGLHFDARHVIDQACQRDQFAHAEAVVFVLVQRFERCGVFGRWRCLSNGSTSLGCVRSPLRRRGVARSASRSAAAAALRQRLRRLPA